MFPEGTVTLTLLQGPRHRLTGGMRRDMRPEPEGQRS